MIYRQRLRIAEFSDARAWLPRVTSEEAWAVGTSSSGVAAVGCPACADCRHSALRRLGAGVWFGGRIPEMLGLYNMLEVRVH